VSRLEGAKDHERGWRMPYWGKGDIQGRIRGLGTRVGNVPLVYLKETGGGRGGFGKVADDFAGAGAGKFGVVGGGYCCLNELRVF